MNIAQLIDALGSPPSNEPFSKPKPQPSGLPPRKPQRSPGWRKIPMKPPNNSFRVGPYILKKIPVGGAIGAIWAPTEMGIGTLADGAFTNAEAFAAPLRVDMPVNRSWTNPAPNLYIGTDPVLGLIAVPSLPAPTAAPIPVFSNPAQPWTGLTDYQFQQAMGSLKRSGQIIKKSIEAHGAQIDARINATTAPKPQKPWLHSNQEAAIREYNNALVRYQHDLIRWEFEQMQIEREMKNYLKEQKRIQEINEAIEKLREEQEIRERQQKQLKEYYRDLERYERQRRKREKWRKEKERYEREQRIAQREYDWKVRQLMEAREEAARNPTPQPYPAPDPPTMVEPEVPAIQIDAHLGQLHVRWDRGYEARLARRARTDGTFKDNRKDRKANAKLYRGGLYVINQTFGRYDEANDFWLAFSSSLYLEKDGRFLGYVEGEFSALDLPQMVEMFEEGTLHLDYEQFFRALIFNFLEDAAIGYASRGSRRLAEAINREIGIFAGPAL